MVAWSLSAKPVFFSAPVLPDSDLQHSAEQLRVVGDDPADVDDQLLLENSLTFPTVSRALAVDDALNHAWRQWVWDHLLLLAEQTECHLANMGSDARVDTEKKIGAFKRALSSTCVDTGTCPAKNVETQRVSLDNYLICWPPLPEPQGRKGKNGFNGTPSPTGCARLSFYKNYNSIILQMMND